MTNNYNLVRNLLLIILYVYITFFRLTTLCGLNAFINQPNGIMINDYNCVFFFFIILRCDKSLIYYRLLKYKLLDF
jgi:hypothetical protein